MDDLEKRLRERADALSKAELFPGQNGAALLIEAADRIAATAGPVPDASAALRDIGQMATEIVHRDPSSWKKDSSRVIDYVSTLVWIKDRVRDVMSPPVAQPVPAVAQPDAQGVYKRQVKPKTGTCVWCGQSPKNAGNACCAPDGDGHLFDI